MAQIHPQHINIKNRVLKRVRITGYTEIVSQLFTILSFWFEILWLACFFILIDFILARANYKICTSVYDGILPGLFVIAKKIIKIAIILNLISTIILLLGFVFSTPREINDLYILIFSLVFGFSIALKFSYFNDLYRRLKAIS